jgi:hypothetical protein
MKLAAPFSSEQTIIGHGVYLIAVALLLFFALGALRLVFAFPVESTMEPHIGAAGIESRPVLYRLRFLEITNAYQADDRHADAGHAGGGSITQKPDRVGVVTFHIAPPLALGIGIIDIASAALTGWAIETARRAT